MVNIESAQDLLELLQASQGVEELDLSSISYALYARKSTTSEDRQASSVPDQIKECMDKVVIPNDLNTPKIYKDNFSAKVAGTRDDFKNLIKDIENGRINGLIAWHPDRLSRNMKEAGEIIDLVDRGLIKDLRFATFTFENTPAGKMLLGITFVIAKQYSEHLAESVDRGNKRAVEDGEFIGKYKHGYVVNERREFEPDSYGFTLVKHMFEMALEGKAQKEILAWINDQSYRVQKRPGGEYVEHTWDKDDVSKLLKDPHYVGVHKWGKTLVNLTDRYDFEPMISVHDFFKINKIDSLQSDKVLAIRHPRVRDTRAKLLNGMIYCADCGNTMSSMVVDKRDKVTNEITSSRYYYRCETENCHVRGKSARAGLVIGSAQEFLEQYLFVTKSNYTEYVKKAKEEARKQSVRLDSTISGLKTLIANKQNSYDKTKEIIISDPKFKEHYDLDKYVKEIANLRSKYEKDIRSRAEIKSSFATFEEYLKLFESTAVILGKIRDMETMDALIRIFFSNFTVQPITKGSYKGATVSYELKEPWKGFVDNGDFVCGGLLQRNPNPF
jgi:site-specific DNA recombinase